MFAGENLRHSMRARREFQQICVFQVIHFILADYNGIVLARTIPFSAQAEDSFFQEIPTAAAVFALRGDGEPYVSKTANLRRRLQRLLGHPEKVSRRLNLREKVRDIEFTPTGSDFEAQLLLYRLLRENFPKTYSSRLRLRPAPLIKLHLKNEYPRASVTTRFASSPRNIYYGPFFSRSAAEKFASDALDFFKMRRCVDDLHPDPAFPGCVYSEMTMCLAPCFKGCTDDQYRAEVARVQTFFDSGGESLQRDLAEQREHASAELKFEDAAAIHVKIEKLKPLLSQLPEIVRRIDRLDAIIVQPSAAANSVCLFRFHDSRFSGPVEFEVENRNELPANSVAEAGQRPARTMESRVESALRGFSEGEPAPVSQKSEQLSILKRWYYRSHRIGEIFFADERGEWPLRRMVRGIGRVYRGEKNDAPALFSATQPPA